MGKVQKVKLLCWAQSKYNRGNRHTADMVVSFVGETRSPIDAAKALDMASVPTGFTCEDGCDYISLGQDFGVTIIYASGRKRKVREWG